MNIGHQLALDDVITSPESFGILNHMLPVFPIVKVGDIAYGLELKLRLIRNQRISHLPFEIRYRSRSLQEPELSPAIQLPLAVKDFAIQGNLSVSVFTQSISPAFLMVLIASFKAFT